MPSLRAAAPAIVAAAIVLLAGLLYICGYREQYYALAEIWGAAPFRTPFLDMHGVTSAIECHRLGYDVYIDNPCDVFHRPHAYSPLWLWLAVLPITTRWDNTLGLAAVVLFLVALAFLPPGRDWRLITLATVSSTTMFAMERANVDLLMFVMAMLVVRLRFAGYAVALLAGMLKFYPIVLLVAAVRERVMLCIAIWAVALGAVALWFALDGTAICGPLGTSIQTRRSMTTCSARIICHSASPRWPVCRATVRRCWSCCCLGRWPASVSRWPGGSGSTR